MTDSFLDKTYDARDAPETAEHYAEWAETYDAELAESGYATPERCAEALARYLEDRDAPILDFGCGTGLGALALNREGFTTIDGIDTSAEMLAQAHHRGLYRRLTHINPGEDVPGLRGDYAAICAIGVIGIGAAPPSVMGQIAEALAPGGLFVFSLSDHALADDEITAARDALLSEEVMVEKEQQHGEHLPGIDLKSCVYVFEKL